jgi:hypothetical protein
MKRDFVDFLLNDLRPSPGMYLTAYNLSYLSIYLTAVETTCWQLDKNGAYLERFSGEKGFVQWSWHKYGLQHRSYKLDHYLEFAKGNEEEALNFFFKDLETYHIESSR